MTSTNRTVTTSHDALARKCDQLNRRCASAAVTILIAVVLMAAIVASVTR